MVKLVKLFVVLAFLPTIAFGQEGGKFIALSPEVAISSSFLNFGYLYWGETALKAIDVANLSDKQVRLHARVVSDGGRLKVRCPEVMEPGASDHIYFEYSMHDTHHEYRSSADTVVFMINGDVSHRAVQTDYILLGRLPETDFVPAMSSCPSVAKLVRMPVSRRYKGSIQLANNGEGPLEIYSVLGDAKTNLRSGTSILPGKTLKVCVNSDSPSARLELFTNDPQRPYKELIFKY